MKLFDILLEDDGLTAIVRPTIGKLERLHTAYLPGVIGQTMHSIAGALTYAINNASDIDDPEGIRDVVNQLNHYMENREKLTPEKVEELYHRLLHSFDPLSGIRDSTL